MLPRSIRNPFAMRINKDSSKGPERSRSGAEKSQPPVMTVHRDEAQAAFVHNHLAARCSAVGRRSMVGLTGWVAGMDSCTPFSVPAVP